MILDLSLPAEVGDWPLVVDVLDVVTTTDDIALTQNQFLVSIDLDVLTQIDVAVVDAPFSILTDGMAISTQIDILTQRIAAGYF